MIIRLYNYLHSHAMLRWVSLLCFTMVMAALALQLSYKEDISDFLPLGTKEREALSIYQDISGANKLIVLFDNPGDADATTDAIDDFCERVEKADTAHWIKDLTSQIDMESIADVQDFVYANIPYFLTEQDYTRIDSMLTAEGFVSTKLQEDREALMMPMGDVMSSNIGRDPLGLFAPTLSALSGCMSESRFEIYDGYIFTPDMKKALVMLSSPFGNSETENNAQLLELLEKALRPATSSPSSPSLWEGRGGVSHVIGGPQIAVGNARQIKHDAMIAVFLASVLILSLLLYSFRSVKNILLIALSIGWGWLFALSGMSLLHDSVSIIVIGISSVILGIAVNYPLHLVAHAAHQPDTRKALREIFVPLLVGNITTVGAFLALVPLQSTALQDLGLFASLLLIGTIAFVLIYLPHHVRQPKNMKEIKLLNRLAMVRLHNKPWLVAACIVLTAIFGWFAFQTEFDSNMANINYMTPEQKEDMEYFQNLTSSDTPRTTKTLYVVSSADNIDAALDSCQTKSAIVKNSVSRFLPSMKEQQRRLVLWQKFKGKWAERISREIHAQASPLGFSNDAFDDFHELLLNDYQPQEFAFFQPLTKTVFAGNISINSEESRYSIIDKMELDEEQLPRMKRLLPGSFDVVSMNSALADSLSDNFNYIGWACSIIVFLFLWFSFGRLELALLAFLPMAVSWIWILGIMALLGIKFNIVNVILATFIFGQGDDYTIFITEGCQYEYAHRKPLLASYKSSIILSAMIMFIGIGTLIVAKHPALHSLAEITIIGMFCVVLMAWMIPPLIFSWMTRSRGRYRRRPLILADIARTAYSATIWLLELSSAYILGFFLLILSKRTKKNKSLLHRYVTWWHRWNMRNISGVTFRVQNTHNEHFDKPCIIVCNHQSMLDPMVLMAISPKIVIVANQHSSHNPIVRKMFSWLDYYTVYDNQFLNDIEHFRKLVSDGYSIAVFPEAERNPDSSILRFHKGAFLLAQRLGLDLLPMYIHGMNNIMPIHDSTCHRGTVTIRIRERITKDSPLWADDHRLLTQNVHKEFIQQYDQIKQQLETEEYYSDLVDSRLIYKGLSRSSYRFCREMLLKALANPHRELVIDPQNPSATEENINILKHASRGIARNINFSALAGS